MPIRTAKASKPALIAARPPAEPPSPRPASNGTIRILVADDHSILRAGLRRLLEAEKDFAVVGEAASPDEIVAMTLKRRPALLLFNGTSGLEAVVARLRGLSELKMLLLATDIEKPDLLHALRLGVRGVVSRHSTTELLFKSIRSVIAGEYWIDRDLVGHLVELLPTRLRQTTVASDCPARTLCKSNSRPPPGSRVARSA